MKAVLTTSEIQSLESAALNHDLDAIIKIYSPFIDTLTCTDKKLPNYQDIKQACYLGICQAYHSYDPKKGSFLAWSSYYIHTKRKRQKLYSPIVHPTRSAKKLDPDLHISSVQPKLKDEDPRINLDRINDAIATYLDYTIHGIDPNTSTCTVLGCTSPVFGHDRCRLHYTRYYKRNKGNQ